jgi:hypothetical protein
MAGMTSHRRAGGSRVLLLNPPWRVPILRDYFCSSVAKADYLWHPIDLLAQSGWLAAAGFEVHALDAIAERLDATASARRIEAVAPDAVLALTAPLSESDDDLFLRVHAPRPLAVTGEQAVADPAAYLRAHPAVDAVVVDFATPALARFLRGERAAERLPGLVWRDGHTVLRGPTPTGTIDLPVPLHAHFPQDRYRMPGLGGGPFATLLTAFGCPHRCRMCNSGSQGFRPRDLDGIGRELEQIRALGVQRVFVKDMSFGMPREHAEGACQLLEHAGVTWCAYVRPDEIDAAWARVLYRSGCRQVQLGVESGDARLRERYGKRFSNATLRDAVAGSRAAGLRVGCHLVLGIPGEDARTLWHTRRLLRSLAPDYVSLNLAETRLGSADSRATSAASIETSFARLLQAARVALYLDYYLQPAYMVRTAARAWRDDELGEMLRLGRSLALRSLVGGR